MRNLGLLQTFLLILGALLFVSSCRKNPVGPQVTPNVQLSVDYVTCTEVWLKLGFADSPGGGEYRINRDGNTVLTGSFTGPSAIVRDSTAQAVKSYTYTAGKMENGHISKISSPLYVITPDSTSNDFAWTTYTLGDGNGYYLNDVATINDTLAYAAGEIYLKDSTGQVNPLPNNLALWNHSEWQLQKVPYHYQSQEYYHAFQSVFAFNAGDIWFCGNGVIQWDGVSFVEIPVPPSAWGAYQMNKMWGSSQSLYIVGDGGSIALYRSSSWYKVESGSASPIDDVWGKVDPASSTEIVYCAITDPVQSNSNRILRIINGSMVDTVAWDPGRTLYTVWTCPGAPLYAGGAGLWKNIDDNWQQIDLASRSVVLRIRGNAPNDVFAVGTFGLIAHYNGSTWKVLDGNTSATFFSVSVKGDMVIAVGVDGANAAILVGRRQ